MTHTLYQSSMFTALRDGRVGVQCERSLRFLLFLLDGWTRFQGTRKPLFSKPDDRVLRSIYFDKFAMLSFRLWDSMFHITRKKFEEDRNEETSITFPSPFVPIPGKHGPGPGRVEPEKGERPIYLIDILYELQNGSLLAYFEVNPPASEPKNHKHHKTTVVPGLPVTDEHEFLRGFTRLERDVLFDLRNALKKLGPSEIRAIGTHSTHDTTIDDIEREFRYMGKKKGKVTDNLSEGRSFKPGAQELLEYAEEAWNKSKGNRDDYRTARRTLVSEITNPTLIQAFESAQEPLEDVWPNSDTINKLVERADHARLFTGYLNAVADVREHLSDTGKKGTKRPKKAEKVIGQNSSRMRDLGFADLPSSANDIFMNNTNQITDTVRTGLIRIVNTL